MYCLIDGLREAETDADVNYVSSSASETANVRSAIVTSNAESQVQYSSLGMYIHCNLVCTYNLVHHKFYEHFRTVYFKFSKLFKFIPVHNIT